MHFVAPFRARCALARVVAFVDHCAVEDVFPKRDAEMGVWIGCEGFGLEGGEFVEHALVGLEEGIGFGLEGLAVSGDGSCNLA